MKIRTTFVILLALTMLLVATPVLAGGDKNRGAVGTGDVVQVQVSGLEYESRQLVQEQVLTQNQEQPQVRVQARVQAQSQWQNGGLADLWF